MISVLKRTASYFWREGRIVAPDPRNGWQSTSDTLDILGMPPALSRQLSCRI